MIYQDGVLVDKWTGNFNFVAKIYAFMYSNGCALHGEVKVNCI